jgi:hypothetical protein
VATQLQAEERRSHDRPTALMRVGALHRRTGKVFCLIKNISPDGVMAHPYGSFEPGEPVQVEIKEGQLLPGRVIWSKESAIGIRFDEPIDVRAALATELPPGFQARLPRVDVVCFATVRIGSMYHHARLVNLSLRGAALETAFPVELSGPAVLRLPDLPPIHAQIRWSDGVSLGMSFNEPLSLVVVVQWLEQRHREKSHDQPNKAHGEDVVATPLAAATAQTRGCGGFPTSRRTRMASN